MKTQIALTVGIPESNIEEHLDPILDHLYGLFDTMRKTFPDHIEISIEQTYEPNYE